MPDYHYRIEGQGRHATPFLTTGTVSTARPGDFPAAVTDALRASFEQLTEGVAVFGHPEQTCQGPFTITKLTIEAK